MVKPSELQSKETWKWDEGLVSGKEAKERYRNADDHNVLYMCMNCQRVMCVHAFIYT